MIEIDLDGRSYKAEMEIYALFKACECNLERTTAEYLETTDWADEKTFRGTKRAMKVVRRAVDIGQKLRRREEILTNRGLVLPLAAVTSAQPWDVVAKKVFRKYHGALKKLELPGYFLEVRDGTEKPVCIEMLQGRSRP